MPNYDEVRRLKERYGDFILMVGRLDSDKDQATVINARKRLELDFCQTPNVVFVGDGTERQQLEELVDAMDLRNSVFSKEPRIMWKIIMLPPASLYTPVLRRDFLRSFSNQ